MEKSNQSLETWNGTRKRTMYKGEGGEWSSPPLLHSSLTGELLVLCLNRLHCSIAELPLHIERKHGDDRSAATNARG
jgi:hypothetical protein